MCSNMRARMLGRTRARLAREGVGRRHGDHVHQQRAVDGLVEIDVAHGERAQRFAVIAVGERDEARLALLAAVAPVVKAHLHRHFDGGGAVVGEEAAIEPGRREAQQLFGEGDRRRVRETREDGVFEPVQLLAQRRR